MVMYCSSEWGGGYLQPNKQFFRYIMTRTSYISMTLWICLLCTKLTLSWTFIVLAHWNNSPHIDVSLHSDTLSWFKANQSLLFLLNAACLAEKQQIPILQSSVWSDLWSNPWSTTLTESTLTLTPLMWSLYIIISNKSTICDKKNHLQW
jgi:hypothetical protein